MFEKLFIILEHYSTLILSDETKHHTFLALCLERLSSCTLIPSYLQATLWFSNLCYLGDDYCRFGFLLSIYWSGGLVPCRLAVWGIHFVLIAMRHVIFNMYVIIWLLLVWSLINWLIYPILITSRTTQRCNIWCC